MIVASSLVIIRNHVLFGSLRLGGSKYKPFQLAIFLYKAPAILRLDEFRSPYVLLPLGCSLRFESAVRIIAISDL